MFVEYKPIFRVVGEMVFSCFQGIQEKNKGLKMGQKKLNPKDSQGQRQLANVLVISKCANTCSKSTLKMQKQRPPRNVKWTMPLPLYCCLLICISLYIQPLHLLGESQFKFNEVECYFSNLQLFLPTGRDTYAKNFSKESFASYVK